MAAKRAEDLARESAPQGGGFVGVARKMGSELWELKLITRREDDAVDWYEDEVARAKVYQVTNQGKVTIHSSK